MARIKTSPPFCVAGLSILTVFLLWQDARARGHEEAPQAAEPVEQIQQPAAQTIDTAEPVESPVKAVPEAELAQELVNGTMTVDGETRSIFVETCALTPVKSGNYVQGRGKDDAGNALTIRFMVAVARISVRSPGTFVMYETGGTGSAAVYQVDGSTVTLDRTFHTQTDRRAEHLIQLSFDCSG